MIFCPFAFHLLNLILLLDAVPGADLFLAVLDEADLQDACLRTLEKKKIKRVVSRSFAVFVEKMAWGIPGLAA